MTGRLAGTVIVTDPDTRRRVRLSPGMEVPAWASALITNPAAWAEPPTMSSPSEDRGGASDGDPPKGNASREKWAAYAATLGVEVEPDMSRDDIQSIVAAAQS